MTDFRIEQEGDALAGRPRGVVLVEVLINGADTVAERFREIAGRLPYRAADVTLQDDDVPELVRSLATATWKRISDEVPAYGFAEALGRRYREGGNTLGALLLHWQVLRRAIHLMLAEKKFRTGRGDTAGLRQMALMDYTLDWATEASIVGYVLLNAPADG